MFQGTGRRTDLLAGDANRQRGEFVLVVEGAPATSGKPTTPHDALLKLLLEEVPVKSAALAAALTGASRNTLYARALVLKDS